MRDLLSSPAGAVAPDTHKNIKHAVVGGKQDNSSDFGGDDESLDRYIPRQDEEKVHATTRIEIDG